MSDDQVTPKRKADGDLSRIAFEANGVDPENRVPPLIEQLLQAKLEMFDQEIVTPLENNLARVDAHNRDNCWVGTYTAHDGRVAVVTQPAKSYISAYRAACQWVADAFREGPNAVYEWREVGDGKHWHCFDRTGRLVLTSPTDVDS